MFSTTRRQVLTALGLVAVSGKIRAQSDEATANTLAGVRLEPFIDPLPIPRILKPRLVQSGADREDHYRLTLSEFRQKLHRDLPATVVWGFEGSMPGPTLVAKRDCPVVVDWFNRLPQRHRLLVDHSIDGAGEDVPEVRTTIHLHGAHVRPEHDGYPDTWITPGHSQRTVYPNHQSAATLWYHDHSMGITRLNAAMGLAGTYIIRDPAEDALGLPTGAFDVPLVLQDRVLDPRGQIVYAVGPGAHSVWVPEYLGSHILVNGRVTPFLDVEPTLYRFRLINASNARVFQMALDPGQLFIQIGTDDALLPQPIERAELVISSGERVEVLIDFRGREGRRLRLTNFGPAPFPGGGGLVPGSVLQFRVRSTGGNTLPATDIPTKLTSYSSIPVANSIKTRQLTLMEEIAPAPSEMDKMSGHAGGHRMLLNGARFMDPVTEDPRRGTVEIWELVNLTADAHPIHLHAVHFQVLGRQRFDVRRQMVSSELVLLGKPIEAPPEERGWKDTVLCPPGQVTRIIVPFTGEAGRFVWHCHILEHEDNEMMRPMLIRT